MRLLTHTAAYLLFGLIAGLAISMVFFQPAPEAPLPSPDPLPPSPPAPEPDPLPEIDIIVIQASDDCSGCEYAQLVAASLSGATDALGFTIRSSKEIPADSQEARGLIGRYGLDALPALVIGGSPSPALTSVWTERLGTEAEDGSLVLRYVLPPYQELPSGLIKGIVDGIAIRPTGCPECSEAMLYLDSLESTELGIYLGSKRVVDENSTEGQELIERYNITRLPTILLSDDVLEYDVFFENVLDKGTMEDERFVLRDVAPPYLDLADSRTVKGVVDVIYILDPSCEDCFDPRSLPALLVQAYGVHFRDETFMDAGSSEAEDLIARYSLEGVPAILLSPDASEYPLLSSEWEQIGSTIEEDGWFVFRSYEQLVVPYRPID